MDIYEYLENSRESSKSVKVLYQQIFYRIAVFRAKNHYIYEIFNLGRLRISDENFSKIEINEKEYNSENLKNLISVTDAINRFYGVTFTYFNNKLLIEETDLNTECFLQQLKFPLQLYGFRVQDPNFPFCKDIDLVRSKLDDWQKEYSVWCKILLYQKVNRFLEITKQNGFDSLQGLDQTLKDIDLTVIDFVYTLEKDDQINFINILSTILYHYKYLPNTFIKIY